MRSVAICCAVWLWLSLSATALFAQDDLRVLWELEGGVSRFSDGEVNKVFPVGIHVSAGPVFALADQGRLRLRPHAGAKFFFNELDEWTTEHLRFLRLGGQVSYDAFYIGQTTFFPYAAADFNWVANYDAESDGGSGDDENVSFSDSYLRGAGFSQAIGLRVQYREMYIKLGYEFFDTRLRVRKSIIDEDLAAGYITPISHPFNFNTINLSVGLTVGMK
ncbi:hypothetical protein [Parapedobacter sp. DT-150]|uniref:hypothetical protein n=1 Tax=Parapedobacter sp. DT-150 TaxID=3396162 RepID=UPI003F19E671